MKETDYVLSCNKIVNPIYIAIFSIDVLGHTKFYEISEQDTMHVATFDQLETAEFCTKQETIYVIICPSLDGTYYGMALTGRPSIRPFVRPSDC